MRAGAPSELVDRLRSGVPRELQELKQWLVWRLVQMPEEDKPRKVPHYVSGGPRNGRQNSPQDKARFATFDHALAALARGGYDGLGLAMAPEAGLVGVDLDKCIAEDGSRSALAQEILGAVDTFAEISPSGGGLHSYYKGEAPDVKTVGVELFHSKGFLTVTGRRINGADIAPLPPSLRGRLLELTRASRGSRVSHENGPSDPVIQRLTERGLVKRHRQDGGADIVCPFSAEHTTGGGGGDTVYWPPHTGGYPRGHFHCLHAHCAGREDAQFLAAIGLSTTAAAPRSPTSGPSLSISSGRRPRPCSPPRM